MNSQPRISNRVNTIAVSATKAMAEKAAHLGDCLSLGQGVPSFATPTGIINRLTETLTTNPACGKYTLQTGMLELRRRIARMLAEEQGIEIDAEREICLTVGAMEGLLATLMSLVDPGERSSSPARPTPPTSNRCISAAACRSLHRSRRIGAWMWRPSPGRSPREPAP